MSKLLVIFGATGKQGGSVIEALLATPSSPFKLRGITRDPSKPNAKALTDRGVEMVAADVDDKASLVSAMKGAYGVFAVTDYWASMNMAKEIQQGKNIADAAKVSPFFAVDRASCAERPGRGHPAPGPLNPSRAEEV